jgi:hypothetical protein
MKKRGSKASAISDRSGFRFPMSEMVLEPGTNFLVHKSESDGIWNAVTSPLNTPHKFLKGKSGDPYPVSNARPRPSTETVSAVPNYEGEAATGALFYVSAVAS